MPYPKILAFVEGKMERMFLNNNFHYVTVIPVANGTSWSLTAMADQIESRYRARNFFGDAIVIWIDRERREESAEELSQVIRDRLVSVGAIGGNIHILVGDRMCENIILADEDLMRDQTGDPNYTYAGDGCHGKHALKSALQASGKGFSETGTGVMLLKKTSLLAASTKSPSVLAFVNTFEMACWWLEPRH